MYVLIVYNGKKVKYIGKDNRLNPYIDYTIINTHIKNRVLHLEIEGFEGFDNLFPYYDFKGDYLKIDTEKIRENLLKFNNNKNIKNIKEKGKELNALNLRGKRIFPNF